MIVLRRRRTLVALKHSLHHLQHETSKLRRENEHLRAAKGKLVDQRNSALESKRLLEDRYSDLLAENLRLRSGRT